MITCSLRSSDLLLFDLKKDYHSSHKQLKKEPEQYTDEAVHVRVGSGRKIKLRSSLLRSHGGGEFYWKRGGVLKEGRGDKSDL